MVASRQPELETPGPDDLYDVGVVGVVARMLRVPDGTLRLLVQGGRRVRVVRWTQEEPYLAAEIEEIPELDNAPSPELTALMRNVQSTFTAIVEQVPYLPEELQIAVANVDDPAALSHLIAASLRIPTEEKQALLEEPDVTERLRSLAQALARELEVISIGTGIQEKVQSELDRNQREFVLRQQLKAIQEELGDFDESAAEANELRERLAELRAARGGPPSGRPRARPPREPPAAGRRARRHPHVPRVDRASCRGTRRPRTTSISRTRARCSTPITTGCSR